MMWEPLAVAAAGRWAAVAWSGKSCATGGRRASAPSIVALHRRDGVVAAFAFAFAGVVVVVAVDGAVAFAAAAAPPIERSLRIHPAPLLPCWR